MRRGIIKLVLIGCASALLAMGSAQARSLNDILDSGTLRVGVNPNLPPLGEFNEKNQVDGFDVDFSRRIAEMLGVELEVVRVQSTDRIPYITSGKIDYAMGAMTRTSERAKVINFTLPVHTEVMGVLTVEGRKDINSWKELNSEDITLVQVRGTTPIPFIEKNLPKAKVLKLDGYSDVVRALAQGRGDALLDIVAFVNRYTENYDDVNWKVLDTPVNVDYCALGVAKSSDALEDWLNVAIFELHDSGFVSKTWKKWFGRPMLEGVQPTPFF